MTAAARPPGPLTLVDDLVTRARAETRAPASARRRAALEVADALGCMALGASHPLVRRVALAGEAWRDGGPFRSLASARPLGLGQAVVLDSLACHIDEFDSLHPGSAVVTSAAVIPATLQVAAWRARGGRDLLDAVLAGYAVITHLGARAGGADMYTRGWWPTSSYAAVGAAVGVGVAIGLDDTALRHAIGIASAAPGGLLSDDRLAEGHYLAAAEEASRGARAALFAEAGAQASWTYLDGPGARAFGPPHEVVTAQAPGESVEGCVIKSFPCARPLHGFAAALGRLAEAGVDLRDARTVRLGLPPALLRFVTTDLDVAGPTEAAASAAFVYAAAREGRAGDALFFREASLAGLPPLPRISLEANPRAPSGSWACDMALMDGEGRTHALIAEPATAVRPIEVMDKLHANLAAAGTPAAEARRVAEALDSLNEISDIGALRPHSPHRAP